MATPHNGIITTRRERIWKWLPVGWVRRIFREGGKLEYMNRYALRAMGPSGANPCRVYIHNFLAPDDAQLHNHPSAWSFSIVLWGSYTEEIVKWCECGHRLCERRQGGVPLGVASRRVRWFNWITARRYHRIAELHPGPGARGVWTLFVCGPLAKRPDGSPAGWGFWVPGRGHVPVTAEDSGQNDHIMAALPPTR